LRRRDLGHALQGPDRGGAPEEARALVQPLLQWLQGGVGEQLLGALRPAGFLFQAAEPFGVEGANGVADALVTLAQQGLDLAGGIPLPAFEERLAAADNFMETARPPASSAGLTIFEPLESRLRLFWRAEFEADRLFEATVAA